MPFHVALPAGRGQGWPEGRLVAAQEGGGSCVPPLQGTGHRGKGELRPGDRHLVETGECVMNILVPMKASRSRSKKKQMQAPGRMGLQSPSCRGRPLRFYSV